MGEPREPPENGNPFPLAETAEEEGDRDCRCMGMTRGGGATQAKGLTQVGGAAA